MTRHALPGLLVAAATFAAAPVFGQQPAAPAPAIFQHDEAGKIIRVEGCLDAYSLLLSPAMDDVTKQNMAPWVAEWVADVNQIAIDNLDFLEKIDAGLIDTADLGDSNRIKFIQGMFVQLNAAGPLSARLHQRGVISLAQFQALQRMTYQYIQGVYGELSAPRGSPEADAQARNDITRFSYHLSCRDARAMYHRQVVDSARLLDRILPALELPAETKAAVEPRIAAVRSAQTEADTLVAGLALLKELPFDTRRAFLTKAVELGAASDPYHPPPALPVVKAPPAAAKLEPLPAPPGG